MLCVRLRVGLLLEVGVRVSFSLKVDLEFKLWSCFGLVLELG